MSADIGAFVVVSVIAPPDVKERVAVYGPLTSREAGLALERRLRREAFEADDGSSGYMATFIRQIRPVRNRADSEV